MRNKADFGRKEFIRATFRVKKREEIEEILKKYSYYGKPATLPESAVRYMRSETTQKSDDEDPLQILKRRYAKGEIAKEEYEEMKKVLE